MTAGPCRFLIVNADDFGGSHQINSAIILAHQTGALTSASLMVAEPASEAAAALARATPGLGVGLHLSISCDRALLPRSMIPAIVDEAGMFGASPFKVGLRYALSRRTGPDLKKEMEAQFERFAQLGIPWSHADGHQHFHLHPNVFCHFLDLCDLHGVTRIRLPAEELWRHLTRRGDRSASNIAALIVFRILCRKARRELARRSAAARRSYFYCNRVYGLLNTGNMNRSYLRGLVPRLGYGAIEIYFHPGSPHARALPPAQTSAEISDVDLDALVDPALPQLFSQHGIETGRYEEVESLRNRAH